MGHDGVQKILGGQLGCPPFGVSVFVTCKASGFLYHSEAGFARATSSLTRELGPLVILAPAYGDGLGACFQMAACATQGYIDGQEYVRTKASLWSIDSPGPQGCQSSA